MGEWEPQRTVTVSEARDAARRGGLSADHTEMLAAGWDNTVLLVDDTWVLRFPRREIALLGFQRERELLGWLGDRLAVPVPQPEHAGLFGDPPWPWWAARFLPGDELIRRPGADLRSVASDIGRMLRTLHDLPAPTGLPVDPFLRGQVGRRAERAGRALDELAELGLWDGDATVRAVLETAGRARLPPPVSVLSHGDLYARHVLIGAAGRVSGVIDWGDVCRAPAGVDVSFAYSALPPAIRREFFAAYGAIDEATELRARTLAVFSCATLALYARDVGDEILLKAALAALPGTAR